MPVYLHEALGLTSPFFSTRFFDAECPKKLLLRNYLFAASFLIAPLNLSMTYSVKFPFVKIISHRSFKCNTTCLITYFVFIHSFFEHIPQFRKMLHMSFNNSIYSKNLNQNYKH